jgi:hypothetical protein
VLSKIKFLIKGAGLQMAARGGGGVEDFKKKKNKKKF